MPGDWRWPFAYLAYRQGMTFNSGYVARANHDALIASCASLNASVRRGDLDPSTLYVVGPRSFDAVKQSGASIVCGKVDGHGVCVSSQAQGELRRFLEAHP
jgi:hypothetical protein